MHVRVYYWDTYFINFFNVKRQRNRTEISYLYVYLSVHFSFIFKGLRLDFELVFGVDVEQELEFGLDLNQNLKKGKIYGRIVLFNCIGTYSSGESDVRNKSVQV